MVSSSIALSAIRIATPAGQTGGATGTAAGTRQNVSSSDEQAALAKLKARDRQVRQHEQAHLSAAGGLATSAASFTYERGPDGQNYAVGGEVNIDTSPGRSPEETLRRAATIRAAALAPADPSAQDRAVAAAAEKMAMQARAELAVESTTSAGETGQTDNVRDRLAKAYGSEQPASARQISAYA